MIVAIAAPLVAWAPACAKVLDLDDFQDAIAALCKCNLNVPQFGGSCEEVLTKRLDTVSPQARQAWLEYYAETCEGSCARAFDCYQQAATCSSNSCNEPAECCEFVDGVVGCEENDFGERVCVYP